MTQIATTLGEATLLSNKFPGPWQLVLRHPTDIWHWHIFNVITRRYKKIGPVQLRGKNYHDEAVNEAMRRNVRAAQGKHVIFSHVETINDTFSEPQFWSNDQGWVSLPDATVFDSTDHDLPTTGEWFDYHAAVLSFWREITGNN